MVHIPVETNFPDSDEAILLGELSGDRDAWRYVIRLWGWGLDTDRASGILKVPNWKIAEVSGYPGDPNQWVDWLKRSGLLVPKRGGLYMSGWSRMKRFFKERKRLRDYRKKKKVERDAKREQEENEARTCTLLGNTSRSPSPSPSPSPSHEEERDPGKKFSTMTEIEAAGYPKYKTITGDAIPMIRNLLPIYQHELDAAFSSNGRRWSYAAQVVESYREKANRPKPPPGSPKPQHRKNRPPTREELLAVDLGPDADYDPVLDPESDCYQPDRDPNNPAYTGPRKIKS